MEGWKMGHRAQPLLSLEFCPDLIFWHCNWGFPCTPSRSPYHCPKTWLLKLSLVWLSCLPGSGAARPALFSLMVVPGLALFSVSSIPFHPDEQQKVEQFPPGHPAGEQEAVQQGPAGGDGAEPIAEADPARGLRDAPAGDRPQVVL